MKHITKKQAPTDLIKIRVTGPVASVQEIAIELKCLLETSDNFVVKQVSDIYPNRPPQENLGRVYLEVLTSAPDFKP